MSTNTQPAGGLSRGFTNVSMLEFLKVALPLTAVFLLAFVLEYRAQVGTSQARLLTQETSVIQRGVRRAERELEVATGDLHFVADLVTEIIDDATPGRLTALERSALAFVRRRPGYFQIRFIDTTGREALHVENSPGGPRITPSSEFEDKSGADYFIRSMRLEAGEVFASAMELSTKNGEIERPYRPVVRLATPIDDASGQRRGIVVVNARGEHFLSAFERNHDEAGIQRMIVNADGYWLQHRPEVEWGFALEHERSFARTFPDVWAQMLANPQGRAESSEGLFYFDTVTPQPLAASATTQSRASHYWMFISLVPRQLLDDMAVQIATPLLVFAMPSYSALLLLSWLLAAAIQRRRMADEALQSLESVRSTMMTAALDAIVVMDEAGTALEFNPSAQEIFGYTLEEARGRLVADLIIPETYRETHRLGLKEYLATGEGRIIHKHIDELTAIRKSGEEFPVELTVCPVTVAGKRLFYGFLRDLSESGRSAVRATRDDAANQ